MQKMLKLVVAMIIPAISKEVEDGEFIRIDPETGKITLAHGPVAELSWPAMTMGFAAKEGQLGDLNVGEKVRFSFRWDGKTAEIESIGKI